MFSQGGLSLEQAPPLSVVLRFFLTASLFGILLGLFLLGSHFNIFSLSSYAIQIMIVHLLALGIMASFMLGALFQMLPVIAGVVIKSPLKKVTIVHGLFIVGFITQLSAFAYQSSPLLYLLSALYLGSGLLYAIVLMLKELFKVTTHSSSSQGIIFALLSFSLTIFLGIYLLLAEGGFVTGSLFTQVKELHYSFALFGWLSLLIVSVSFQVIEMFYVTPKYPNSMSNYLTFTIFALLIVKSLALLFDYPLPFIGMALSTLFLLYATVTLDRLNQRKRPTSDATVWFWRLGMGLLIVSSTITLLHSIFYVEEQFIQLSYITFIGFGLSIVLAMVYKIVPFLTWFHLSNQGYMEAPMMHDVIHPKKAKIHFYVHTAMLLTWMINTQTTIIGSLLIIASFGWLLYNLIFAMKKYSYTQKHTQKIEW